MFVCFEGHGDHRDLHGLTHSLPTRRSSVLAGGGSIRIDADNVVAITATRGLDASATGNGDGGSIELFGANGARIFGDLRARGGASGGDGGFIETSGGGVDLRSEEHTSELQSLMRNSYAVFCLKKQKAKITNKHIKT